MNYWDQSWYTIGASYLQVYITNQLETWEALVSYSLHSLYSTQDYSRLLRTTCIQSCEDLFHILYLRFVLKIFWIFNIGVFFSVMRFSFLSNLCHLIKVDLQLCVLSYTLLILTKCQIKWSVCKQIQNKESPINILLFKGRSALFKGRPASMKIILP